MYSMVIRVLGYIVILELYSEIEPLDIHDVHPVQCTTK